MNHRLGHFLRETVRCRTFSTCDVFSGGEDVACWLVYGTLRAGSIGSGLLCLLDDAVKVTLCTTMVHAIATCVGNQESAEASCDVKRSLCLSKATTSASSRTFVVDAALVPGIAPL